MRGSGHGQPAAPSLPPGGTAPEAGGWQPPASLRPGPCRDPSPKGAHLNPQHTVGVQQPVQEGQRQAQRDQAPHDEGVAEHQNVLRREAAPGGRGGGGRVRSGRACRPRRRSQRRARPPLTLWSSSQRPTRNTGAAMELFSPAHAREGMARRYSVPEGRRGAVTRRRGRPCLLMPCPCDAQCRDAGGRCVAWGLGMRSGRLECDRLGLGTGGARAGLVPAPPQLAAQFQAPD